MLYRKLLRCFNFWFNIFHKLKLSLIFFPQKTEKINEINYTDIVADKIEQNTVISVVVLRKRDTKV